MDLPGLRFAATEDELNAPNYDAERFQRYQERVIECVRDEIQDEKTLIVGVHACNVEEHAQVCCLSGLNPVESQKTKIVLFESLLKGHFGF